MRLLRKTLLTCALTACAVLALPATAQTVRIASLGDAASLDPYAFNETTQMSTLGNVFEPLTAFDKQLRLIPGLASDWQQVSPTVWRFSLRRGVQFHDGRPFTADDVVFSFGRAAAPGSDFRAIVSDIKAARKIDDYTVEIETALPVPILPEVVAIVYMMSKTWCEENQATEPVDRRQGVENAASFRANGTGPYRVLERQPEVRTVFVRNDNYWGEVEGNAREVIFTPVANDATRVAALLSGGVDVIEPVPLQDVDRVDANPTTRVLAGPELRTIFLGMDQKRDELLYSSVKGKNPFKDKRVRQAFYQAIDIEGIKKTVMRGAAVPSAQMVGAGVNGFQPDMQRLPYDPTAAKKLLAAAGYPDGFELTLNCPNDRYVNDSRICQAVAANLAKVGVKINLQTETKATYFPKVLRRDTSFFMSGWTPATNDAHNMLNALVACENESGAGQVNMGNYCNPKIDALIQGIQVEIDPPKRNAMIREAFAILADDVGYLPLHQQALAWGVANRVKLTQRADNFMVYKWLQVDQ